VTVLASDVTRPSTIDGVAELVERPTSLAAVRAAAASAALTPVVLERAQKRASQLSAGTDSRAALLGILMGRLVEVDRSLVLRLLDVKMPKLVEMLHGETQVPKSAETRWALLAEVLGHVRSDLRADYLQSWLESPAPDLDGRTPLACLTSNTASRKQVLELSRRLIDPSFA
jgi:hypothetical protein